MRSKPTHLEPRRVHAGLSVLALAAFAGIEFFSARCLAGEELTRIAWDRWPGSSAAVVVSDVGLLHTRQFLPALQESHERVSSVAVQLADVLTQAQAYIAHAGATAIVKINFYVTSDDVATEVMQALREHFSDDGKPAVSLVVTQLPSDQVLLAADFVATMNSAGSVSPIRSADGAVLPTGARLYVSGQAEQSESLVEATRNTLLSLQRTLKFLGRSDDDIVQLKAFLQPMSDSSAVRDVVSEFFGDRAMPPLILVEWKSSSSTPIEIELIASGGVPDLNADAMEFLTPPGMKQSPVYSRVCRINDPTTIFVSGLCADFRNSGTPDSTKSSDAEVVDVFAKLKFILDSSGSDFQHLAKATYYVSNEATSASLNRLRPDFYNPQRPPAASKAVVGSVGIAGCGLMMDMIAVPNSAVDH